MKYFLLGILLAAIGTFVSFIVWGSEKVYMITGGIGILFIGISMVLSGSLVNGDKMRANFATETNRDRTKRNKFMFRTALIGIPNLLLALVLYLLSN